MLPEVYCRNAMSSPLTGGGGEPPRLVLQIFAGDGLEPLRVARPVTPYDVAPTLANDLGVKPPSGSIGNPLVEVLPHKQQP